MNKDIIIYSECCSFEMKNYYHGTEDPSILSPSGPFHQYLLKLHGISLIKLGEKI
jgi:hypothetical protein